MLPYEVLIGFKTLFIRSNGFIIKRTYFRKLNDNKQNIHNLCTILLQNKFTFELYCKNININNVKKCYRCYSFSSNTVSKKQKNDNIFNEKNNDQSNERLEIEKKLNEWISTNKEKCPISAVSKKFRLPASIVRDLYQIVENELDSKLLNVTFDTEKQWKCNFNVKWPEDKIFTTYSKSKQSAMNSSALKCLCWLHLKNKIRNNVPIIYSTKELESIKTPIYELNIENSVLKQVEDFLNQYEYIINKHMESMNNTKENEVNLNNELMQMKIYEHPISNVKENEKFRNNYLLKRLLSRNTSHLNLPIMNYRDQILKELEKNQILVIKGDTGCGKSTQVPQFILDEMIKKKVGSDCSIIVSQPRKISAISIAERVAFERNENLGDTIGYQVRQSALLPKQNGSILFCTTGMLLKKMHHNPTLNGCSHVVLDEAHERSVETDLLLLLLRRAVQLNSSLKLIVMSATLNANLFQNYFNCGLVKIPGKLFHVEMHFLDDINKLELPFKSQKNNENTEENKLSINHELIVELIRWISINKPQGSILCFLPGWSNITYIQNMLIKNPIPNQLVIPLHSAVSHMTQKLVFKSVEPSIRKIILSTDIAETGVTVPDVVYVIDSACSKISYWNEHKNMSYMAINWISKANLNQRKGRAGRVRAGESYHIITKEKYSKLSDYSEPEIFRVALETLVLNSKRFTNEKVQEFLSNMLQPPKISSVDKAVDNLTLLDALDHNENLTNLGKKLLHFYINPKLSKAIVLSSIFQCFGKMVTISANLTLDKGIFYESLGQSSAIREQKLRYHPSSDHIAEANIFERWKRTFLRNPSSIHVYCHENFLLKESMSTLFYSIKLICKDCYRAGLIKSKNLTDESAWEENHFSDQDELVLGVLLAGTEQILQVRNFAFKKGSITKKAFSLTTENNEQAFMLADCINHNILREKIPNQYLTYFRKTEHKESRRTSIYDSSRILPITIVLFSQGTVYANPKKSDGDVNKVILSLDKIKNVKFECDENVAKIILRFRILMWSVVKHYIEISNYNECQFEEPSKIDYYKILMINVLLKLLSKSKPITAEDNK